jgi:hypothetical protein
VVYFNRLSSGITTGDEGDFEMIHFHASKNTSVAGDDRSKDTFHS